MSQSVWLVRHAQTGANVAGRYLGTSDDDLDATGLEQARQLASWAVDARIDTIVTSPARRAARTAATVANRLGMETRTDERLRELDFGTAEGRTLAELRQDNPQMVTRFELDPVTYHFAGGEDPRDAVDRIRSALADLLQRQSQRPLVVTHNAVLRLLVCDILGIGLEHYRRLLPIAEHCAITELSVTDGATALRRFNAPVWP